jgi:hypothetical protein
VTDLHGWITQQVAGVERIARQARDDVAALLASGDVRNRIAERHITLHSPDAVLRRCEADRRILARHRPWPGSDYCDSCDQDLTTRIHDCPELLDLAHAHGITDEILTSLDRPQPPPPPRPQRPSRIWPTTPITDVPPALRGPNWKADR